MFNVGIKYNEELQQRYEKEVIPYIPVTPTTTKNECELYLQNEGFERYKEEISEDGINSLLSFILRNGEREAYFSLFKLGETVKSKSSKGIKDI